MRIVTLLVIFLASFHAYSQRAGESVAIHLNGNFFVSGETLHFTIYCLDSGNYSFSAGSKIGYVAIVNEQGKAITETKVFLANGMGSGDYFFPANIATGNYTVVAFTRWMRNGDLDDFARRSITVINPQLPIVNSRSQPPQSVPVVSELRMGKTRVSFGKRDFGKREKVSVRVVADTTTWLTASVRLDEPFAADNNPWSNLTTSSAGDVKNVILPDLRGELLTGLVLDKTKNTPVPNALVTLSSPGKNFSFFTSVTDSSGRYYFNVDQVASEDIYFHVHNSDAEFLIRPDREFPEDYTLFVQEPLTIDTTWRTLITKHHVSAQVENAFYSVKKDSAIVPENRVRFFGTPDRTYNLDEFTRFPTMEDIFREIIPEVVVRARDGKFSLLMFNSVTGFRFQNSPLVLIDGIPVADANIVMGYDASLIRKITLKTKRYYYGGLECEGIMSIETYDGTAKGLNVRDGVKMSYLPAQPTKLYYAPEYFNKKNQSRIPDFRTQLYWKTMRVSPGAGSELTFFTGDLEGNFVLELSGIDAKGEKIFLRETFSVK